MLKILHINEKTQLKGGTETYISQVCKLLESKKIYSSVITIENLGAKLQLAVEDNTTRLKKDCIEKEAITFIKNYFKIQGFSIIHIHNLNHSNIIHSFFSYSPVIRTMHEPRMICPGQGKFWRYSETICTKPFGLHCLIHAYTEGCNNRHPKRLVRSYLNTKFEISRASRQYSDILVFSQYMKEEAVLAGISSEKIIVIPPFVNLHTGPTLPKTINTPAKILFLGRLSRTKGVHYLIEAGKILINRGFNIQIDIVGDGYDRRTFEALIPFQLKKNFSFHGWLNHMSAQKFVKGCDILAFPSIYPEAFGLSGIEAMSYGKPIVAFNVGGIKEWLIDGYNGLLVNVKNTEQFAMALSRLIQDKDIYNTYSQNSVLFANQKFTVQKHLDSLVEIYTKAFMKYRSTFDKTTN